MDEYFYLTEDVILELNNAYVVENRFSNVIKEISMLDMKNQLKLETDVSNITCGPTDRIKMIYDPKSVLIPSIHKPHKFNNLIQMDHNKIYFCHFVNYNDKHQMTSKNCTNYIKDCYPIVLFNSKKFYLKE